MEKQSVYTENLYDFSRQNTAQFLERRLANLYGTNSKALKAMDFVMKEMCKEKGMTREDGSDYYIHCLEVTNTLISFCVKNEDVICAALLHDTAEDINWCTLEFIRFEFGDRVAELVGLLTKSEEADYDNEVEMKNYLQKIKSDREAAAIKTADRMHNMMTLEQKDFKARYKKALQTEKYFLSFFKECRYLYPRYENLFYSARAQIEPLIFHIKSFYEAIEEKNKKIEELEEKITKQRK